MGDAWPRSSERRAPAEDCFTRARVSSGNIRELPRAGTRHTHGVGCEASMVRVRGCCLQ